MGREDMKQSLREANREISQYLKKNEAENAPKDSLWFPRFYERWRVNIFGNEESEDRKRLICALLYEQTNDRSISLSSGSEEKTLLFAWMVGHEILLRIIYDGKKKEGGESRGTLLMDLKYANSLVGRKK